MNTLQKDIDFDQRLCGDLRMLLTGLELTLFGQGDTVQGLVRASLTVVMSTLLLLSQPSGWMLVIVCYTYSALVITWARRLASPVAAAAAARARCEGDFRFMHTRAREFAESIAFFGGA